MTITSNVSALKNLMFTGQPRSGETCSSCSPRLEWAAHRPAAHFGPWGLAKLNHLLCDLSMVYINLYKYIYIYMYILRKYAMIMHYVVP